MAFADKVAAAFASGEPFRVSHNVQTGLSEVVFLTPAEIQSAAAASAAAAARQQTAQAAVDAKVARLRGATTIMALRQFIEDDLL